MIKSNHSFTRHEQRNALKFKLYTLVVLAIMIMIKAITTFISLSTMTTNLTLIDYASIQKTSQTFSQERFRAEVYFST